MRRHVQTVGDDRGMQARLRHGVKEDVLEFRRRCGRGVAEMGPANRTCIDRGGQRLAHRTGMADEKLDLLLHARADHFLRRLQVHLGRDGDDLEQRPGDLPPVVEQPQARRLHAVGLVRAAMARVGIQPWAFHVEAEAVARIELDVAGEIGEQLAVAGFGVGDERGEEAGAAVRVELFRGVMPGVVGRQRAVEIDPAEAVDLNIDQSGRDPWQVEHVLFERNNLLENVVVDMDIAGLAGERARRDLHASTSCGLLAK